MSGRSAPRTVVVVGPQPPPIHGAARVTRDIVTRLRERPIGVVVRDTAAGGGSGSGYHLRRVASHLRAAATCLRPRHGSVSVYVAGAGGLGVWYQLIVVFAARLARRTTYFHHHSYAYVTTPHRVMSWLVRVGGPTMRHIALCPGMAAGLLSRYPDIADIRVCSNAGLVEPVSASAVPAGPIVLGHLGNLSVQKGLAVVIDTLRRTLALGREARLLLAGPAADPEAARLIAQAQTEFGERVEWVGPVDADAVDAFYARLDLFVFPSRYRHEAEPLVVYEAERAGVPCVAYDIGCLASMAEAVVPVDVDLPEVVVGQVAALERPGGRPDTRRRTRERFAARHESALAAQRELIDLMVG